MKLYSVNYRGPLSNEWSIVTIHKTLKSAEAAMHKYIKNCHDLDTYDCDYTIYVIDTDIDSDVIYDCYNLDTEDD